MGFMGGNNDSSDSNTALDEQINQNKAELQERHDSLFKTRLELIKGEGAQSFEPTVPGYGYNLSVKGRSPNN